MTRFHTTSAAVILAVAALGLGACGDDNKSSTSGDSATNDAIATNSTDTTNGTTGTGTGKSRTTADKGKTGTTEKGDDKGGSGGNSGKRDSSETELTGKNVKSTAKTVCTSFLPTALQRDLKSGKKSAEEIAKDYSRAFPTSQRKAAYDGCLAGLKTKD